MEIELWFTYVATVLLFMSTPGPSHLLMLSNSIGQGLNRSWATAIGDLSANTCQMIIASAGLASLIHSSQTIFLYVKWAGVIYLIYLGLRQILGNSQSNTDNNQSFKSINALYLQGFITSASNPKAIIFFAALFPQFVSPHAPSLQQFAVLGMTYLILDGCFLFLYGFFAEIVARRLKGKLSRGLQVAAGGLIIAAAVLLCLRGIEIQ